MMPHASMRVQCKDRKGRYAIRITESVQYRWRRRYYQRRGRWRKELEYQGKMVQEAFEVLSLRLWLFAYSGLREDAQTYAREHSILWSSLAEFNELLQHVGLRQLPEL